MPAQFTTKSVVRYENTETCVIMREVEDGTAIAGTSVYSGPCDFQPQSGSTATNPAGVLQMVDGLLMIDPAADGSLPAVVIADGGAKFTVAVNGLRYDVIFAAVSNAPPQHLKMHLKRGPQHLQPVT